MSIWHFNKIVEEYEHLIGRDYKHNLDDAVYEFYGIVWGKDDLYYGMCCKEPNHNPKLVLLSCVGSIENQGFELVEK